MEFKMRALMIGLILFFCFDFVGAQNFIIHKVQKGDNLYILSKKYNTTVDLIYKNNPSLTSDNLKIGTELRILSPQQKIVKHPIQNIKTTENTVPITPTPITSVVKIKNDTILHKVAPKETLYGISKLYNISTDDIKKWNHLSGVGIQVGSVLKILKQIENNNPVTASKKTEENKIQTLTKKAKENEVTVVSSTINQTLQKAINLQIDTIYHQVKPKETMFGIAKIYNVSVDNIKKWNILSNSDIKIGTFLKILSSSENKDLTTEQQTNKVEEKKQEIIPEKTKQETIPTPQPEKTETIIEKIEEQQPIIPKTLSLSEQFANQTKTNAKTVKATGAPMNTTDETIDNTFFALHKTAKIGSVIKIRNLENSKIAYAKVIGKLPDTDENRKVLVRLSLGVQKAIKMGSGKAYMEISFIEE